MSDANISKQVGWKVALMRAQVRTFLLLVVVIVSVNVGALTSHLWLTLLADCVAGFSCGRVVRIVERATA